MTENPVNEVQLIATASELLSEGGYTEVSKDRLGTLKSAASRVYEDDYSVVCLTVFPTWRELYSSWTDWQAEFADLVSEYLKRSDAKSWDGYLVLMTPATTAENWSQVEEVKRDTARMRKLVGTGDTLKFYSDVETLLAPLLPLNLPVTDAGEKEQLWSLVRKTLRAKGIALEYISAIIDAYEQQRNPLEAIRNLKSK